jgi:hypothetical protein
VVDPGVLRPPNDLGAVPGLCKPPPLLPIVPDPILLIDPILVALLLLELETPLSLLKVLPIAVELGVLSPAALPGVAAAGVAPGRARRDTLGVVSVEGAVVEGVFGAKFGGAEIEEEEETGFLRGVRRVGGGRTEERLEEEEAEGAGDGGGIAREVEELGLGREGEEVPLVGAELLEVKLDEDGRLIGEVDLLSVAMDFLVVEEEERVEDGLRTEAGGGGGGMAEEVEGLEARVRERGRFVADVVEAEEDGRRAIAAEEEGREEEAEGSGGVLKVSTSSASPPSDCSVCEEITLMSIVAMIR